MNPGLPSDDEIIPRLLKHEEAAYTIVVRAYQGILIQVSRAIIGPSLAEEVVQEAWISAFKALPKFERRSSLKTWLIRIVSNNAKTRLRHESRSLSFSEIASNDQEMVDPAYFDKKGSWTQPPRSWDINSPEEILSSQQLKACLDKAIQALPALPRSVMTLRDMQDQNMDMICKVLDISESNARVLLHRARSQVRESIARCQRK